MLDSRDEVRLSLVDEDAASGEVDEDLNELRQQVATSEEHVAKLQGELKRAADHEAESAQRLDTERQRRAALDQQLHEARQEATRLLLDEAFPTRNGALVEAEELLQASRVDAEREASQITKQAFDKANEMIALARREGMRILGVAREEDSVEQLDLKETQPTPSEPRGEQTTSVSSGKGSPTDLDASARFNGNEPDSVEVEMSENPPDEVGR